MKNKNVWRYIFYYEKYAGRDKYYSRDKYYFDIITDQGKKVARELALKEVSEIKDWLVLTLVTKRKATK